MNNIFLIGFMGTGKSTVSAVFEKKCGMERLEMDEWIVRKNKRTVSEIFRDFGEEYFRNEETLLLKECARRSNLIISCGGGAPMREINVQEMKKNGVVVLLTAAPETILERVKEDHSRPLIENNKTVEYIAQLMEKRREKYEAAADLVIETDGKSAEAICEEILEHLQQTGEKD